MILVVEDEALARFDIAHQLADEGYQVLMAACAEEAIAILESRNDIRTIFTDIDMPGSMNGLKLAVATRDKWPSINIIITTGMTAPTSEHMPTSSLFVPKPYQLTNVLKALRSFG